MISGRKAFQAVMDSNRTRQERIYRLLIIFGLFALAIGAVSGIISGQSVYSAIIPVFAFVLVLGIAYFTIKYNKIQIGAILIAAFTSVLFLPFNFMLSGGIYGGGSIWFIFEAVFICLVVENTAKYVLLACGFVIGTVCYLTAYFYPQWIFVPPVKAIYVDSFSNLVIVASVTCGMILFQNSIFRSENETTKKQKKEIEELNQMQNRFFSNMSHEIRTPINTIIGLNEMILREDVSDEVADDAKSIQGASKMLLALINDILDMSKIESGRMDIVPVTYRIGDMLSDIVNMIWVRAQKKNLEFHIDVDPAMPQQLYGDEVRIKQILINVLNNAVKYTSEGSVTLSIHCQKKEKGHAIISFSVTDTGMGIKKESIPHLFSAFKRVDEQKNRYIEGTGLGLSIVKQLVELLDGEIAVNSVYTKGSTFVITLPQGIASEDELGELNLETRYALNERKHYKQSFEAPNAHVLIVDDNETNLMVAEKLLRDTKVGVDLTSTGQDCLVKTLQQRYDVILMDHLMPGMDGIECLHAIRKQVGGLNQNTPVVALTANAGGENQSLYRREGFDGYLLKPVTGIQLETELLRHLPRELVSKVAVDSKMNDIVPSIQKHKDKKMILISTDSVCDLPKQLVDNKQIAIMPYHVMTKGGVFLDGVETETEGVLSYIKETGNSVRSQEPKVEDYEDFFAEQLTRAHSIIHISMAEHVSCGYQNAKEASKTFDNVFVINSGHLSSGMGMMVLKAAECAAEGMSAENIIKEIEQLKKRVKTSFIVNSTEYLARVGRISDKADSLCRALMIHPVIVLKNSFMKVCSVRIGKTKYARQKYIASTLNSGMMRKADHKILFITYAGLSNAELKEIEEQVRSKAEFDTIICQKASPAISANCGPGSFGLIFALKE